MMLCFSTENLYPQGIGYAGLRFGCGGIDGHLHPFMPSGLPVPEWIHACKITVDHAQ